MNTIFSFVLTLASIVGLVVSGFVDDGDTRATLFGVLVPIATGGAWMAARGEPMRRKSDKAGPVLLVLLAMLLAGCPAVFNGATSTATLRGYGPAGVSAVLTVDGETVCTATGARSGLRVDAATAKRICAAHRSNGCHWVGPPALPSPVAK